MVREGVAAPGHSRRRLRERIPDEVAHQGKLGAELVVNASDFFTEVRGGVGCRRVVRSTVRRQQISGLDVGGRIGVDQARWNRVVREFLAGFQTDVPNLAIAFGSVVIGT